MIWFFLESCAKRVVHSPTDELSPVSTRTVTEQNWKTSQSGDATVQDPFADDEFPVSFICDHQGYCVIKHEC